MSNVSRFAIRMRIYQHDDYHEPYKHPSRRVPEMHESRPRPHGPGHPRPQSHARVLLRILRASVGSVPRPRRTAEVFPSTQAAHPSLRNLVLPPIIPFVPHQTPCPRCHVVALVRFENVIKGTH